MSDDSSTSSDEPQQVYLKRTALIKKLTPQHKDRLFIKIWSTKKVSQIVVLLLNDFKIGRDECLNSMIQLLIDFSSYQYINISNFIKYNELIDIVSYMATTKNSILNQTGKYIVSLPKYSRKCKIIGEFLETFVILATKDKILFDQRFTIFFEIVKKMSESKIRAIKHTGVFIALKLQTGFVRVSHENVQRLEMYQEKFENPETSSRNRKKCKQKLEDLSVKNNSFNMLISFIYTEIFQKNWNFGDSKLQLMRRECIYEVGNWIEIFPARFLHKNYLDFIIESIMDNHFSVRLAAVSLLSNILRDYHPKISDKIKLKICTEICKRMNDTNYGVAIKSVETLTMINNFFKLPHTMRDEICKLIYDGHYPLAATAAKFLVQRMNNYLVKTNDPYECIKMLVYFEKKSKQKGFVNKLPLVIETVIDTFVQLEDVSAYISILEQNEMDDESVDILIKILTEVVFQTYYGNCSMIRAKQLEKDVNPEKVKKMTRDLIDSLEKLTKLVSPLDKLTPLLYYIKDYGMKVK